MRQVFLGGLCFEKFQDRRIHFEKPALGTRSGADTDRQIVDQFLVADLDLASRDISNNADQQTLIRVQRTQADFHRELGAILGSQAPFLRHLLMQSFLYCIREKALGNASGLPSMVVVSDFLAFSVPKRLLRNGLRD
ncbi:MAG: hypothetical protein ACRERS_05520 [Methylococcales bacterium]